MHLSFAHQNNSSISLSLSRNLTATYFIISFCFPPVLSCGPLVSHKHLSSDATRAHFTPDREQILCSYEFCHSFLLSGVPITPRCWVVHGRHIQPAWAGVQHSAWLVVRECNEKCQRSQEDGMRQLVPVRMVCYDPVYGGTADGSLVTPPQRGFLAIPYIFIKNSHITK